MLRLLILILILIPNIACAQFSGGPFGGSSSSGSATITCADTGVIYANGVNTPSCDSTNFYYSGSILHVPSIQTAATSVPQTDYYPALGVDTHWIIGVNGDGGNDNDDSLVISEGTTLGSSNRIKIAPGGLVTINNLSSTNDTVTSLLVTTINSSSVTVSADTLVNRNTFETLTNKRLTKRDITIAQSATPAINTNITDHAHITGLAQAITSMSSSLSGTCVAGDTLWIDITDNGTARGITWGTSFESSGTVILPTTTVLGVRLDTGFVCNEVTNKWRIIAAI